jgi:hypothetical protein
LQLLLLNGRGLDRKEFFSFNVVIIWFDERFFTFQSKPRPLNKQIVVVGAYAFFGHENEFFGLHQGRTGGKISTGLPRLTKGRHDWAMRAMVNFWGRQSGPGQQVSS